MHVWIEDDKQGRCLDASLQAYKMDEFQPVHEQTTDEEMHQGP